MTFQFQETIGVMVQELNLSPQLYYLLFLFLQVMQVL